MFKISMKKRMTPEVIKIADLSVDEGAVYFYK
jgi:hypothetical protein